MKLPFRKRNQEEENKKIGERVQNIILKIHKEYPELTTRNSGQETPFLEIVKAYYELKAIESQRFHNRIIIILTVVNLILVGIVGYLTWIKP